MKLTLRFFINGTLGLATLILLFLGIATYRSFHALLENNLAVSHSHEMIVASEKLLSALKDTETGQRGYLLTRDSTYLQPYFQSLIAVPVHVKTIQQLTATQPEQRALVAALQTTIQKRLDILQENIHLKANAIEVRSQTLRLGRGKQLMDSIRTSLATLTSLEQEQLRSKNQTLSQTVGLMKFIIYAVMGFASVYGVFSFLYITHQLRTKDRYEKEMFRLNEELHLTNNELIASNEELATSTEEILTNNEQLETIRQELEVKVKERTAVLEKALQNLKAEMSQRRQTEDALQKSQNRFQIALKNAPVSVFAHDNQLRYTWVYNTPPGHESSDSLIGQTDADTLQTKEGKQLMDLKQEVLTTGQGCTQEVQLTIQRKKVHCILTLEPLYSGVGEPIGITGAAYDITPLKKSEKNLKKTLAELKKRNYELDTYVYKVSHDLRAPLASILGLIQLIEMEPEEESFGSTFS